MVENYRELRLTINKWTCFRLGDSKWEVIIGYGFPEHQSKCHIVLGFLNVYLLSGYNCFAMLLVSAVQQSVLAMCIQTSPPSWTSSQSPASNSPPLSQPDYHRAPSWALCALQQLHSVLRIFKECSCLLAQQIFTTALLCSGRPGLLTLFYRWRDSLWRTGARFLKFLA